MKSGNNEDPEDREERLRARRISLLDRREAAEGNARGLTSDLQSVYGIQSLFNFGNTGKKAPTPPRSRYVAPISHPDKIGK